VTPRAQCGAASPGGSYLAAVSCRRARGTGIHGPGGRRASHGGRRSWRMRPLKLQWVYTGNVTRRPTRARPGPGLHMKNSAESAPLAVCCVPLCVLFVCARAGPGRGRRGGRGLRAPLAVRRHAGACGPVCAVTAVARPGLGNGPGPP
jgi:hypothetical protein